MDDFALAMQKINPDKTTLCYNGDITDTNSFKALTDCFPDIDEIMIGRGLFANPALIAELKGISMDKAELRERLKNWHDEILSGYLTIFPVKRMPFPHEGNLGIYAWLFLTLKTLEEIKMPRRLMTISQSFEWHSMLFKI